MSENDLLEERIKNLKENADRLEGDLKETKEEFMSALELLRTDFLKAKDELMEKITGFLLRTLIAIFSVLGAAVVGLVIFIFLNIKP
jgi:hypothetical protein